MSMLASVPVDVEVLPPVDGFTKPRPAPAVLVKPSKVIPALRTLFNAASSSAFKPGV